MRGAAMALALALGCSGGGDSGPAAGDGGAVGDGGSTDGGATGDGGSADGGATGDGGTTGDGGGDGGDGGEPYTDVDYPLCINEMMPDNEASLLLEDGSSPDWIELHNPSTEDVSLDRWTISDDEDDPGKHHLDASLVVPALGFLLLYADEHPSLGVDHLTFALSGDGGTLALYEPDGDGQLIRYGSVEDDFSLARDPDCCEGSDCIGFVFRGTPGESNE